MSVLKHGGPRKADLLVVDLGEGPLVVKDFEAKSRWRRLLGRIQVRREVKAYRWLAGTRGVPALLGRIDPYALAIEWVPGEQLADVHERFHDPEGLLERLRVLVRALHARGLVHLDLRGRENVLVVPRGELFVLDLAGAVWFRPGGLPYRLLFPLLARTDEAAILNWKLRLAPDAITAEDREFLRRFRRVRALWPFNRKGRHREALT